MRVVHLVPRLFGTRGITGGAERYALELARHMAKVVDTTLVAFADHSSREVDGGLSVCSIGNAWNVRGQFSNPFSWRLLGPLSGADVIHCHQTYLLASSFAALYGRLSGRRVYTSDLGGGGWDVSAYVSTRSWFRGHLHISEYSRHIAGQTGNPTSHVILGGVDTTKFSPAVSDEPDPAVIYIGRVLPHKGIDYLIQALPPAMGLRVIGKHYDQRYSEELRRLAEGKNVRFETECDDETLVAAYRGALCVVLPSVYRDRYGNETGVPELLGQTLLEGMACGRPAICTEVASMPEIVVDGVTGFIVPPNDPPALREKLGWLRDHPAEAKAMSAAARERILARFTWPQVVRRCLEIYQGNAAAGL